MGLEETFGKVEKPAEEKKLEVFESEESIKEGLLANLIVLGKTFCDDNLPVALRQALEYATPKGIIASMPELIAAKVKVSKSHDFWQNWYDAHTEEDIGVDKKGLFGKKDNLVLVVVHGGGILIPDRIENAYKKGLNDGSVDYTETEFDNLLEGRLASEGTIQLYTLEDLKKGISGIRKYGVVMPYETAQSTTSGYYKKEEFVKNPLVIARAGGMENLEAYYEKAKHSDGTLGNWHPFKNRSASVPQGRLLSLNADGGGLDGYISLYSSWRFVVVAPKTHNTQK